MISQGIVDVVASAGCSCPILFLLRWVVVMPNQTLVVVGDVVVVEDDNANHAKYDPSVVVATFLLVNELDVLALYLHDVLSEIR